VPAVGNSPNAAVSAARLGLKSALVTNLGEDVLGKGCLESLERDGVAREFVTVHPGKKSNHHYVLWFEDDRTILIKHEEYPYVLPDLRNPKWLYLSSLGEAALALHDPLADYLESHPEVKLAFPAGYVPDECRRGTFEAGLCPH
jgi:sugar/nucleoside kinase (ribokinase family)